MKPSDREFYNELFPALTHPDWWSTGCEAWGHVWFRLDLPRFVACSIAAKAQIGFFKGPTFACYFVDVETDLYPQQGYTQKLETLDPKKVGADQLIAEATDIAKRLVEEKASEIWRSRTEWLLQVGRDGE